jgi:hypothetical protein
VWILKPNIRSKPKKPLEIRSDDDVLITAKINEYLYFHIITLHVMHLYMD